MAEPRAFTNIPGQPGEYAPAAPWWTGPAQARPEAREEAETFPRPPAIGEGFMTPDYSNRSLFEKHVFGEIGGDPFKLNPREALQFADENLPDLFERFFQGTVIWEDREKLTKDQGDQWDEVVKSYHAWSLKEAEMKKAVMTDRYNFMMNQFDNASREYQTALTKVRGRREAALALKRTQEKKDVPKEVSPQDIKRYSDMLSKMEKTEGEIHPAQYDAINAIAEQTGLPMIDPSEAEWIGLKEWLKRAWMGVRKYEAQQEAAKAETPSKPAVPKKPGTPAKPTARKKGPGYFGQLKRPGGGVSTELSVGVNMDGEEIEIPALVPTLTEKEKNYLLAGNKPTKEIVRKAVAHAKKRMGGGESPFAQSTAKKKDPLGLR